MTTKVNRNFLLQCEGHNDLAMAPACLPNAVLLPEGNWGLHPFYNCHTQLTPNWLSPLSPTPKVSIRFGGVSTQRKPFNLARSLASDDSWR